MRPAWRPGPKVHGRAFCLGAAGLHLGIEPVLKVFKFFQDCLHMGTNVVDWHARILSNWHIITCAAVIDYKGRAVEVLAFGNVVYKVQNHSSYFDEW
jgi:hypothetical protein